jgi:RimJ/RimL family protein N-acetyltransferase
MGAFMRLDASNGVIEIGHIWLSPALQKTREATEAIFLMMRHCLDELGCRRLEWKCDALNAPSRRAAERFGFSFEGIFRQHFIVKGRNRDTAWYSILDKEWPPIRAAFQKWLKDDNFDRQGRQKRRLQVPRSNAT